MEAVWINDLAACNLVIVAVIGSCRDEVGKNTDYENQSHENDECVWNMECLRFFLAHLFLSLLAIFYNFHAGYVSSQQLICGITQYFA